MNDSIRLLFTGDISLNDDYQKAAELNQNPFISVEDIFHQADIVVGNIEATCEGDDGVNTLKSQRLKTNLNALNFLKNLNLGIATLANNHVYDNLLDGFNNTVDFLEKENIEYVGAAAKQDKDLYKIIEQDNLKIGFLNYVHPDTNPNIPIGATINLNIYDKSKIINQIKQIRTQTDYVVLLLHWGFDNSHFPEPWQRKDAKEFARAGVDLIVGHHSHTLQGMEKMGNTHVYYGLGNFAFSGFIKNNKRYDLDYHRQRDSIILSYQLVNNTVNINVTPIKIDGINVINIKSNKLIKLSRLLPIVSNSLIWPFYKFYLTFIYKLYFYFLGNGRNPFRQLANLNYSKINKVLKIN